MVFFLIELSLGFTTWTFFTNDTWFLFVLFPLASVLLVFFSCATRLGLFSFLSVQWFFGGVVVVFFSL